MRLAILLLAWLLAAPASAGPLILDGHFQQGGLIFGTTDPGVEVSLDGQQVQVSPDGSFLLGFGREAKQLAMQLLFANYPLERVEATTLEHHSRALAGLKAIGFVREGSIKRSFFCRSRYADKAKFVLYREDWQRLNNTERTTT